jgi:hypothetical protein
VLELGVVLGGDPLNWSSLEPFEVLLRGGSPSIDLVSVEKGGVELYQVRFDRPTVGLGLDKWSHWEARPAGAISLSPSLFDIVSTL